MSNKANKKSKAVTKPSKAKTVTTDINSNVTFADILLHCLVITCKSIAGIVQAKGSNNAYKIPTAHTADIIQNMFGQGHKQIIAVLHHSFNAITGRKAMVKASVQYCLYMGVANYRYAKAQDNVHTADSTKGIDRTLKDAVTGLTSVSKRHNKWCLNTVTRINNKLTKQQLVFAINAYCKSYAIDTKKFTSDLVNGCTKSKVDNAPVIQKLLKSA